MDEPGTFVGGENCSFHFEVTNLFLCSDVLFFKTFECVDIASRDVFAEINITKSTFPDFCEDFVLKTRLATFTSLFSEFVSFFLEECFF